MNKRQVIIIMGPPGAGKGTQAELLSDKFSSYYFETSKILEQAFNNAKKGENIKIKGKKYLLAQEKKLWQTGVLCSPPFVEHLVKSKLTELHKAGENLVIAGSPRTLPEGKAVMPLLEKLYGRINIKIVLIDVPAKETIFRNTHRRICQLMRHPILYSKEAEKLKNCPLDGSKLMRRKGLDDPASIKVRLKEYKNRTFPLVGYFKHRRLKVNKVNGVGPVAAVFARILKSLK